jgi:hypothetical protein
METPMKYLLFALWIPLSFAAEGSGLDKMLEQMNTSVPLLFEKGFAGTEVCPPINFRMKSLPKKEKVMVKIFLDEDESKSYDDREPSSDVLISKKKAMRPSLNIKSKRKQFSFQSTKESILYFTTDYRYLSGTVFGTYEDLKEKKTIKNCVYYIHQEIKK